jgi:hypothetical protein
VLLVRAGVLQSAVDRRAVSRFRSRTRRQCIRTQKNVTTTCRTICSTCCGTNSSRDIPHPDRVWLSCCMQGVLGAAICMRSPRLEREGNGTKVLVQLVDDLDGTSSDEVTSVQFGLDGVSYEIDLNAANAARLRKVYAGPIAAGRRTGGRLKAGSRPGGKAAGSGEAGQIREWLWTMGSRCPVEAGFPPVSWTRTRKPSSRNHGRRTRGRLRRKAPRSVAPRRRPEQFLGAVDIASRSPVFPAVEVIWCGW